LRGGLGRCQAAGAYSPAGEPPFLIGHRLRRTSSQLRAHAGVPVGHDGEMEPPLRAYKTSPSFFPRSPESTTSAAARHWNPSVSSLIRSTLVPLKHAYTFLLHHLSLHACMLANQTACSPEPVLPRPPPDHHCRARPSANSPCPGFHLASSLRHIEASRATHR
jgi:hypothetical protein